jgi:hypothetical protein
VVGAHEISLAQASLRKIGALVREGGIRSEESSAFETHENQRCLKEGIGIDFSRWKVCRVGDGLPGAAKGDDDVIFVELRI